MEPSGYFGGVSLFFLVSTGLEVAAAALVLVPVFLVLHRSRIHDLHKTALYCLFSLYLSAVYILVGMPNITYIRPEVNLNLIPFRDFLAGLRSNLQNVALFVPLGLLTPLLWKKYRSVGKTILLGFGISLAIELLQMLTFRATDVNDLITNTLGTLLGYGCFRIFGKHFPARAGEQLRLSAVITLTAGTMFLVQPFLSRLLWELLP